jgi:hypothetical protein
MECYTIRSVVAASLTSSCALTSLVASRYLHCSIRDGDLMLRSAHIRRTEFVRSVSNLPANTNCVEFYADRHVPMHRIGCVLPVEYVTETCRIVLFLQHEFFVCPVFKQTNFEEYFLLVCNAVWSGRRSPAFRSNLLSRVYGCMTVDGVWIEFIDN